MKTQEEYAREIDEIVRRDVEAHQEDWFNVDKKIFLLYENRNKAFIIATRDTGCDLLILGGTNCDQGNIDRIFGPLNNKRFYLYNPTIKQEIREVGSLYAFKVATAYFRGQGMVPVFEDNHCKLMKI